MGQYEKLLRSVLSGAKDKDLSFSDLRLVLEHLGFQCRIKGDHFIYFKDGIEEIINIQPTGSKAVSGEAGAQYYLEVPVRRGLA